MDYRGVFCPIAAGAMKLSTRVLYGCRAMVDLALHHKEAPVPLEVLAQEERIPARYLSKIIQDLRRAGLIRSVRGARGGYTLSRPPSRISLLDVWEALDGPLCPVDCLDWPAECGLIGQCVTRDVWGKMRKALKAVLKSETLAGLARRQRAKLA